jgi:DNA replication protein DnaC
MTPDDEQIRETLRRMRLHGLLSLWDEIKHEPWLQRLVEVEQQERARRSLENRTRLASLGSFRPLADFDWGWPRKIDRPLCDDLMTLRFMAESCNVVLFGPNGVGKTLLMKNLAHQALLDGCRVVYRGASDMLKDLATQESSAARARRMRVYVQPELLCIDEVGYLSYDNAYADLLFEVVSRRYEARRPIVVTTNRTFTEWPQMFPNATCVVTLVDRLTHRCEVLRIEGDSYRLKESKELAAKLAADRTRAGAAPRKGGPSPKERRQLPLPDETPS